METIKNKIQTGWRCRFDQCYLSWHPERSPIASFRPLQPETDSAERLVELAEHHYELATYYRHLVEEVRS